ncbi:MAG: SDR family NAD(P)-dependent oxidoreductase, partial [Bacteroidota bacterium]
LFEKTMSINVFSVYYFTKALLPTLSKEASVFNICSIASNTILPNCGAYGISKFALLGFSKILREELKAQQVKVTSVLPGATFTAAWEDSDIDPARIMPAKDVAKAIWGCYTLSTQSVVEELTIRPQLGDL